VVAAGTLRQEPWWNVPLLLFTIEVVLALNCAGMRQIDLDGIVQNLTALQVCHSTV
jgi:hypothetical protein